MSSQIWCYLKFPTNWGSGGPQNKVAQNDMKHILVLEFLRSDDFVGGVSMKKLTDTQSHNWTSKPTDTMVTR